MVSARLFSVWLGVRFPLKTLVTLAQLVERKTFNLVVMGSSPICDTCWSSSSRLRANRDF